MTYVFPSDKKLYLYLASAWVDITGYVISDFVADWGNPESGPLDRLANSGTLSCVLRNNTREFSPGRAECMTGFEIGVPAKLVISYDGNDHEWYGKVDAIDPRPGLVINSGICNLSIADWLNQAAIYPLSDLDIAYDQTADQAVTEILSHMPIAPLSTSLDAGIAVLPATFDSITDNTTAYAEFMKLALSEMGYIYVRHDQPEGERLVFENMFHRNSLEKVILTRLLVTEDGDYITTEDGKYIAIDEPVYQFDNSMLDLEPDYGTVINRVKVTAYPKAIDPVTTDAPTDYGRKVLYNLPSPMMIGSRQTLTFRGNYTDPTGAGRRCNADPDTMVSPVAATDYIAKANKDGSGATLTANLTVTAVYDVAGVTYTVSNSATLTTWITKLQARGYGIYSYNPIDYTANSTASQAKFGIKSITINQAYQRDLTYGQLFAESILDDYKQPHTRARSITFWANRSAYAMDAALSRDVGDLVQVMEQQTGVDGYFYITGVQRVIGINRLIKCTWWLKASLTLLAGLSMIGVEFHGGSTDGLKFGYLPHLINKNQRTFSAWIRPDTSADDVRIIAGAYSSGGGGWFAYQVDRYIGWYQETSGDPIAWFSSVDKLTLNAWNFVVITMDCSTVTNAPKMYFGGVEDSGVARDVPASGTLKDEAGSQLMLGNLDTAAHPLTYAFDGTIADARYHGEILPADDVSAELSYYRNGMEGILFQAPCVRTKELALYEDITLTDELKVRDNIFGMVGTRINSPTGKQATESNLLPAPPPP